MCAQLRSAVETGRRVVTVAGEERATFLAAAVAYYAFVSLLPTLLLALSIATYLFGDAIAARVLTASGEFLPTEVATLVVRILEGAEGAGRGGATVVGVVVLLWSALKVFRALDTAFAEVYDVEATLGLVEQVKDALTVAVSIGVGLVAMVGVGAVVAALDLPPRLDLLSVLLLPVLLVGVFFPLYYLFPKPDVGVREALPGAAFAAVGWTLLQAGFQLYAANAGGYQVYGAVGGVLLLVTWLYFAAVVVVFGAVVNVVLSDRQLQQAGRRGERMGERDERPRGAPDVTDLANEVERLRTDLDEFEDDIERRTVDKPELKAELERYVRGQLRSGHARGWGPYLVLLYGVVLTLGAFYSPIFDGEGAGWAVLAMVIIFLSTLGLYVIFVAVGVALNALGLPGRAADYVRDRRD